MRPPPAYKHLEGLVAVPTFSPCNKFRYKLEITQQTKATGSIVCAIMQNPSVASEKQADKSVQFLERIVFEKNDARFEGVKSLIILNQFAYIQTNNFIGSDDKIGPENDQIIEKTISTAKSVIVAWGKANPYKTRQDQILSILNHHPELILYLGKSHPSRASYQDYLSPFVIDPIKA